MASIWDFRLIVPQYCHPELATAWFFVCGPFFGAARSQAKDLGADIPAISVY